MTRPSDIVRTRAGVELQNLVDRISVAEVARRAGTSEAMIRHLCTGRRTPGAALKDRLVALGIPADGWTVPAVPDAPPRPTKAIDDAVRKVRRDQKATSLSGDVERGSAIAQLVESITELEELIDEARFGMPKGQDGERTLPAPATHVAALMRVKVAALDKLANLRGEGEITTAAIRRSKAWQEMLVVIERVLAKYPEAARDFAEAFAKLS